MISPALIDYFRKGPVTSDKSEAVDFAAINKKAAKLGWLIHPDCCNKSVDKWLGTLTANHNATFYKEWSDVLSKDRFELFIDQIRHYISTYGKLMNGEEIEGNGFVPNDGGLNPRWEDLKVLEPITFEELAAKCFDVLKSGIALKEATMKTMCDFWRSQIGTKASKDDIAKALSEIKNKEAQVYLCNALDVLPADEFGMLRMLIFKHTGSTMLIKSKATIASIKKEAPYIKGSPLLSLTDKQMSKLSRIFYRFKPLFLAMKTKATAGVVNALRRLATKNHKPFQIGFWESIVSNKQPMEEVKKRLPELDAWRKIRLMMTVKEKMNYDAKDGVYVIRNGKMFIRENYDHKYDKNWLAQLYFALEESLVEGLKGKACVVKFPESYDIALPTSEKNFVGNFPYGTSFTLTKNNILGVYWRNEWRTRDYDLSMVDISGAKIGWNAAYYSGWGRGMYGRSGRDAQVVYSGDMTNANPEAVELLFIAGSAPNGIIKLNKFNGEDDSKFRFFFANESVDKEKLYGHMVDPNNIKFDTMIDFQGQGEKTIGMLIDGKFTLMDFSTGKGRVSTGGKYVTTIIDNMKRKANSFIPIKEVLLRAGFTMWEPAKEGEDEVKPDLDLTNLEKDTLVNLFSTRG